MSPVAPWEQEIFWGVNYESQAFLILENDLGMKNNKLWKKLLEKIGLHVYELYLYDVCAFRDTSQWNEFRQLFSENKIHGIVFTSASSVRAFFEIMEKDYQQNNLINFLHKIMVVSIGPFTADELKKYNVENQIADVHTVAGSFDVILREFSLAEAI